MKINPQLHLFSRSNGMILITTLIFMAILTSFIIQLLYQINEQRKQQSQQIQLLNKAQLADRALYQVMEHLDATIMSLEVDTVKQIHIDDNGTRVAINLLASELFPYASQNSGFSAHLFNDILYNVDISVYSAESNPLADIGEHKSKNSLQLVCLKPSFPSPSIQGVSYLDNQFQGNHFNEGINPLNQEQILLKHSKAVNNQLMHYQYRIVTETALNESAMNKSAMNKSAMNKSAMNKSAMNKSAMNKSAMNKSVTNELHRMASSEDSNPLDNPILLKTHYVREHLNSSTLGDFALGAAYNFQDNSTLINSHYDIFSVGDDTLASSVISFFFAKTNNSLSFYIIKDSVLNNETETLTQNIALNTLPFDSTRINLTPNQNQLIAINTDISMDIIDSQSLKAITINHQQFIVIPLKTNEINSQHEALILSIDYDIHQNKIELLSALKLASTQPIITKLLFSNDSNGNNENNSHQKEFEFTITLVVNDTVLLTDKQQRCQLASVTW